MAAKPSVAQQGPWAELGPDFQQALRQAWLPAQPLQVRCAVREQTLLVLIEHLLHVEPNSEATFDGLEQTLRQIISDGETLQTKPASLGVDQLPVQLFLRIAGYQQPYASRQFAIDLKPPRPVVPGARPAPSPLSEPPVTPTAAPETNPAIAPASELISDVSAEPVAPAVPTAEPAPDSANPVAEKLTQTSAEILAEDAAVAPEAPVAEPIAADDEPAVASTVEATIPELEAAVTTPPVPVDLTTDALESSLPAVEESPAVEAQEIEDQEIAAQETIAIEQTAIEQTAIEQSELEPPAESPEIQAELAAAEPIAEDLAAIEGAEQAVVETASPDVLEPSVLEPPPHVEPVELIQPEPDLAAPEPVSDPTGEAEPQIEASTDLAESSAEAEPFTPEFSSEGLLTEPLAVEPVLETPSDTESVAESLQIESLQTEPDIVEPITVEPTLAVLDEITSAETSSITSESRDVNPVETAPERFDPESFGADESSTWDETEAEPVSAQPIADLLPEISTVAFTREGESDEAAVAATEPLASDLIAEPEPPAAPKISEATEPSFVANLETVAEPPSPVEETSADLVQPISDILANTDSLAADRSETPLEPQPSDEILNFIPDHEFSTTEISAQPSDAAQNDFSESIQNDFSEIEQNDLGPNLLAISAPSLDLADDDSQTELNSPSRVDETVEQVEPFTTAADLNPVLDVDDQAVESLITEPETTEHRDEGAFDAVVSEAPTSTEAAISAEVISVEAEADTAQAVEAPILAESVLPEDSVDVDSLSTVDAPAVDASDPSELATSDLIHRSETSIPAVEATQSESNFVADPDAVSEATVETEPQPLQTALSAPVEPSLKLTDATQESTVIEPRRFRWSASTLTLAGAIGGFLIASGFYMLTRPCVLGACEPLERAERLGQEAIQTAQTTSSSLAVVEAYGKLNEASYLLGTIPTWSRYHSTAQSLLDQYEDQSVVLGQVVKALEQGNNAAQRSQSPPHPLQEWREIQWQWRDVISQLEKIPLDHALYGLVQRKLTEYRANLTDINQRVAIEQQAQDRISAARKLEQAATDRAKAAKTPANWQETAAVWTQAIEQLRQVPQGSMPYDEAQQLLTIYQPKLAEANTKRVQEQGGAEAYSQALRAAQQAQAFEQQNQWTQAANTWQAALSYAQQVPTNTSYYSQIQPLLNTYTQSLQQAQQNAQRAVALQGIRPTLDRTCAGSPQRCTYTLSPQSIRVQFTAIYDKTVATLIAKATPSTETNLPPAIVNQVNELLRNLADVGNITQTPIELYGADGAKLGTYTPELSGYVPQ